MSLHLSVDGDGGDENGKNVIPGAFGFAERHQDVTVAIYAVQDKITRIRESEQVPDNVDLIEACGIIPSDYSPGSDMFNELKYTSMSQIISALADGSTDGIFSAGNTAAYIYGATKKIGRASRNMRFALASEFPNSQNPISLGLDMGGNISATPGHMRQYALLGQQYLYQRYGINVPTYLVGMAAEPGKGDKFDEEAFGLLKGMSKRDIIEFDGYIETDKFLKGKRKIIVGKARDMNMGLKGTKGGADYILGKLRLDWLKGIINKSGGAILLGAKAPVVKANGNSSVKIITNTLVELHDFARLNKETGLIDRITEGYDDSYTAIDN